MSVAPGGAAGAAGAAGARGAAAVSVSRAASAFPEALPELIRRARELDEEGHPDARACWARLRDLVAARDLHPPRGPGRGPATYDCARTCWPTRRTGRPSADEYAYAADLHEEAAGPVRGRRSAGPRGAGPGLRPARRRRDRRGGRGGGRGRGRGEGRRADRRPCRRGPAARGGVRPRPVPWRRACCGCGRPRSACACRRRGSQEHVAPSSPRRICSRSSPPGTASPRRSPARCCCGPARTRSPAICPPAVAEIDALRDRLASDGPAWHLPRALGLRGRLQLGLRDAAGRARGPGGGSAAGRRRGRPTRSTPPVCTLIWPRPACTSAAPTRR